MKLEIETRDNGNMLVTMHVPFADGEYLRAALVQRREPSMIQIQLNLIDRLKQVLSAIEDELRTAK